MVITCLLKFYFSANMSSRRRYVDVSDILDAPEDENDCDACDLLRERDSDDDDDYVIPVGFLGNDTGIENESDWDKEDDSPFQQLKTTQPAKQKNKPTINCKSEKKRYMIFPIQHLLEIYWKLPEFPLPTWITFTNLLTMMCFRSWQKTLICMLFKNMESHWI